MKVNALQVRQAFGRILKKLNKSGEPIIIEKGRSPVAVLISMQAFKERFIDYREQKKRARGLASVFLPPVIFHDASILASWLNRFCTGGQLLSYGCSEIANRPAHGAVAVPSSNPTERIGALRGLSLSGGNLHHRDG